MSNTFPYVYYIPLSQQHAVESWCRQQWPYTYDATWAMHNYGTRLADRDSITAWQQTYRVHFQREQDSALFVPVWHDILLTLLDD